MAQSYSSKHHINPKDGYAVRAILPRPERRGLPRTGSMLLAWLKLRQRNLGPLLDANGWAVNTRARINIPFGAALTGVATLPKGAQRAFTDPYAEKRTPWKRWVLLIIIVAGAFFAWQQGHLDTLFADKEEVQAEAVAAPVEAEPKPKPAEPQAAEAEAAED